MLATPPNWTGFQLSGNWDVILYWTRVHLRLTVISVLLGFAVSLLLAYLAHRVRHVYGPLLVLANIIYAIPSVVMFALIAAITGTLLSDTPVVLAMALYSMVILVRNITEGLRAVPPGVTDAAVALGYRPLKLFATVELPLALPGIIAGLRVATVSTVSLISVGALLGRGGLGRLFNDGFNRYIDIEVRAGVVAIIVLALALDAVIVVAGRLATPWARRRRGLA